MSLGRKLHDAEQRGARAIHLGAERLKTAIQDISAGVHGLHPARKAANDEAVSKRGDPEQERDTPVTGRERTGIVSVNGRDVGKMRCTGGQRPA